MTSGNDPSRRSCRLADVGRSLLLVIDVQERLLPIMPERKRLLWNVDRLMRGAEILGVCKLVTEQYPERLGATVPELPATPGMVAKKRMFSCRECSSHLGAAWNQGIRQAVICGLETHVCVLQTALDLVDNGWQVHVVVDAVCARHVLDHDLAINRLQASGCILTSTEAVLFEWCESSASPSFKAISQLVRELAPESNSVHSKT